MAERLTDINFSPTGPNSTEGVVELWEFWATFGIDEAELRAGMDDPAIDQSIRQTYELANALGISGTPSFVIGDEAVFGAVGEDVLREKIANMRQCESTIC